jgi:hypothetical protein
MIQHSGDCKNRLFSGGDVLMSVEAPISKHQIPNNSQISKSNDPNGNTLNIGHWDLFEIWDLGFGI